MKTLIARTLILFLLGGSALHAQVPQLINYQGRVAVGGVNFDGSGQLKFALVDADGTASYWSNDGTSTAGSEPAAAVTLTVTAGAEYHTMDNGNDAGGKFDGVTGIAGVRMFF